MSESGSQLPVPPAVLACDVGNTRIALGLCQQEQTSEVRRVAPQADEVFQALQAVFEQSPAGTIIAACSVNSSNLRVLEAASERLGQQVLLVGRDVPVPIDTHLPEPERIGADRLCTAAMAYHRLEHACVVADFGTAITIDCVNEDGLFLGGAILPGLAMGADALARGTAQLPRVPLAKPEWVYGRNTVEAIAGGLVCGARGAVRGIVEGYATDLGHWPLVICTGGDAELVMGGSDLVQAIVPELCLMGVELAVMAARQPQP